MFVIIWERYQNHSGNAKIEISYGNHNRQLLSYQLSSTINNEVINMCPTGHKIGINSVENIFCGGQNIFLFFTYPETIYLF